MQVRPSENVNIDLFLGHLFTVQLVESAIHGDVEMTNKLMVVSSSFKFQ